MTAQITAKANYSITPGSGAKVFWSSSVGTDLDVTSNGSVAYCPRELRVGTTGTLVVQLLDGTTLTLTPNHLILPLPLANITKIIASGSTAYNLLFIY